MNEAEKKKAIALIEQVGEPVDLSDPNKLTDDEARLVIQYLFTDGDKLEAEEILDIWRGYSQGDVQGRTLQEELTE